MQLTRIGITVWDSTKYTAAQAEAMYRANITQSVAAIETTQQQLALEAINISLSTKHKELLSTNSVALKSIDGTSTKFDLNEAVKQIIGKAITVTGMPLADMKHDNINVYYLDYNMFNYFYMAMMESGGYFLTELKDRYNDSRMYFLLTLMISLGINILGIV